MCVQVLNSESGGALRPFNVSILPEEGMFHSNITEKYPLTHSSFYFSLFGPPSLLIEHTFKLL